MIDALPIDVYVKEILAMRGTRAADGVEFTDLDAIDLLEGLASASSADIALEISAARTNWLLEVDAHQKIIDAQEVRAHRGKVEIEALEALLDHFHPRGSETISDARTAKIAWQDNPVKVEIDPAVEIAEEFCTEVPVSWQPDKNLIKKALKRGQKIAGAKLVKSSRHVIA